jgi:hypothetical protein
MGSWAVQAAVQATAWRYGAKQRGDRRVAVAAKHAEVWRGKIKLSAICRQNSIRLVAAGDKGVAKSLLRV